MGKEDDYGTIALKVVQLETAYRIHMQIFQRFPSPPALIPRISEMTCGNVKGSGKHRRLIPVLLDRHPLSPPLFDSRPSAPSVGYYIQPLDCDASC